MRVAMMMLDVPWTENWARAASTVAEVVRVRVVPPDYAGDPSEPSDALGVEYRVAQPPFGLPYSYFGHTSDRPVARRFSRAIGVIEERHGRVDLVHAHFSASARWLPYVKRWRSLPYVVTEHSTSWTVASDKRISQRGIAVATGAYEGAAAVLPVSHSLQAAIEGFGIHANFHVVPNPVDTTRFSSPSELPPAEPLELVTVSRLEPVKRVDRVIDAAQELVHQGHRVHLTVVGDGSARPDLEHRASVQLPADAATFTGWCADEQIAAHLGRAHVYVSASTTENLPVSVIEALACGLPVVATAVGGVPELLTDMPAGRLVPEDDAAALTSAIASAAVDGRSVDQRRLVSEEAARRYSLEAVGLKLEPIYRAAVRAGVEPADRG